MNELIPSKYINLVKEKEKKYQYSVCEESRGVQSVEDDDVFHVLSL